MKMIQRLQGEEPVAKRDYQVLVVATFFVSLSVILAMEHLVGSQLIGGTYFQEWTSDRMMQTSSAANLRADLSGTLWYLHKQPPGLDFLRGLLAKVQPADEHLLRNLDVATYKMLAVLFAVQTTIIVGWLFQLRGLGTALFGGLIWVLHPAPTGLGRLVGMGLAGCRTATALALRLRNHRTRRQSLRVGREPASEVLPRARDVGLHRVAALIHHGVDIAMAE